MAVNWKSPFFAIDTAARRIYQCNRSLEKEGGIYSNQGNSGDDFVGLRLSVSVHMQTGSWKLRGDLLKSISASDVSGALAIFDASIAEGIDPWQIHLAMFPVVQQVLNPPFINPHLPKMYRIYCELAPRIDRVFWPALVRIETNECARRPKLPKIPRGKNQAVKVEFRDIERSLAEGDSYETAGLMDAFLASSGGEEFSRRMLLLGSGYLDKSLGHSISCTAFILFECVERRDQDPWPALAMLADYFHKGRFESTPAMRPEPFQEEEMQHHLLRAASGSGIVNLHHTITIYAIDRARHLFTSEEQNHMVRSWIDFLGEKEAKPISTEDTKEGSGEYSSFFEIFSRLAPGEVLAALPRPRSEADRATIANYLIRGVCDLYQGDYNPHYLTGLGSLLWVLDSFPDRQDLALTALFQYLDYLLAGLRS